MGNTENTLDNSILLKTYNEKEWIQIDPNHSLYSQRNQQIWKNRFTGKIVEIHCFQQPSNVDIYEFRKLNNDFVVEVCHVLPPDRSKLCLKRIHSQSYIVLVEAIRNKLSELKSITQEQALYIIGSSLRGAVLLSKFYPDFVLNEKLIFINHEGKVKIWINQDYASNQLSPDIALEMSNKSISFRIKNSIDQLFTSVSNKIKQNFVGRPRFSLLNDRKIGSIQTYQEGIEYLNDIYPFRSFCISKSQQPRLTHEIHQQTFGCPILNSCMTEQIQIPIQINKTNIPVLEFSKYQKRKTNKLYRDAIPIHRNQILQSRVINRSQSSSSFVFRHSPSPLQKASIVRPIIPQQRIIMNGKQVIQRKISQIFKPFVQERIVTGSCHKPLQSSHASLSPKTQQSSTYTPIRDNGCRRSLFDVDVSQEKTSKKSSPILKQSGTRKEKPNKEIIVKLSNFNKVNDLPFEATFRESSRVRHNPFQKENQIRSSKKMSIDRCVSVSIIKNQNDRQFIDNGSDVLGSTDKIGISSAQFGDQCSLKSGNVQFSFNGNMSAGQSVEQLKSIGSYEILKTPQKKDCGTQSEAELSKDTHTKESQVISQAATINKNEIEKEQDQKNEANRSCSSITVKIQLDKEKLQECLELDRESLVHDIPRTSARKSQLTNRRQSNLDLERLSSEYFKYSVTDKSSSINVNQTPVQTVQSVVDALEDPMDLSERLYLMKKKINQQQQFSARLGNIKNKDICQSTRTIIQRLQSCRTLSPFQRNSENFRDYIDVAVEYFEVRNEQNRHNQKIDSSLYRQSSKNFVGQSCQKRSLYSKSLHKGQIDRIDEKYNKYVVNRQGFKLSDKYSNSINSSVRKSKRTIVGDNYYL